MKAKTKERYVLVFKCGRKLLRSEDYPKTYSNKQAAQTDASSMSAIMGIEYRVKTLKAK